MAPPPVLVSRGYSHHQHSDDEDDDVVVWADSDSQPKFVPRHAGASDKELEGPIVVQHRDSASHAFVWAPEARGSVRH